MRTCSKTALLLLITGLAAIPASGASAQTFHWTADTNNIWDTSTFNWEWQGWVWVNGSYEAYFTNGVGLTLGANITARGLRFPAALSPSIITGGTYTLSLTAGNYIYNDSDLALDLAIGGSNGMNKDGSNRLTLLRPSTFTGPTHVIHGQLVLSGGNNTLPFSTGVTVDTGTQLYINAQQQAFDGIAGAGTIASTFPTGSASEVVLTVSPAAGVTYTLDGRIADTGAVPIRLRKLNLGTQWIRGGMGTYHHGGTSIGAGILGTGRDDALGDAPVTISSGATWTLGGTTINPFNPVTIVGAGAAGTYGALQSDTSAIGGTFFAGPITASGDFTIASSPSRPFTINSTISCGSYVATFNTASSAPNSLGPNNHIYARSITSTGSVVKMGPGYLELTGASIIPSLTINDSYVTVSHTQALSGTIINFTTANLPFPPTLTLNTTSTSLGGLSGGTSTSRVEAFAPTNCTLTLNPPSGAYVYNGVLGLSSGSLIKTGAGQQTLNYITSMSSCSVNQGTLTMNNGLNAQSFALTGGIVNGAGGITAPATTISGGAVAGTLQFSSPSSITGGQITESPRFSSPVTLSGTGVLIPGINTTNFTAGRILFNVDLTATGGSVNLAADPIHGLYSTLSVGRNLNLQGATLNYSTLSTTTLPTSYTISLIPVSGTTTGHFVGLPDGERLFNLDGFGSRPAWYIYYHSGSTLSNGNNIVLSQTRSPLLLLNGSLEQGGAVGTLSNGSAGISGWIVTRSGAQLTTTYQATEGPRAVHLQANGPGGGIMQVITTVPGRRYLLTFDLAGNPDGGAAIKHVRANAGSTSADFTFNITGMSRTSMGYVRKSMNFIATSTTTSIELQGMDSNSAFGAIVDNIRVDLDPCPSDFNHDDVVDFFDYLDFIQAFSASQPSADFNADSVIDFFDYLDFVSAFSAGC